MKNGLNKIKSLRPRRFFSASFVVKYYGITRIGMVWIMGFMCLNLLHSQTSDDQYRRPLTDVLKDIEVRYNVTIRDPENLAKDQWILYADWRFRPDVEETLENVLTPANLVYRNEGENKYKIKKFEYYRLSVEEGKELLDTLATKYNDVASWETRKQELRDCIWRALRLSPLPDKPDSKPIVTPVRKMNGYTVQNVAIETLPGLYICGSLYKPAKISGKIPVILCPNGHFSEGRYNESVQTRCAMLAKMGAITFNYDLFGWGEYQLQFDAQDHRRSLAMTIQALNSVRILDCLLSLPEADPERVGMTGASGGGSQTMLITALDDRIRVSAPVVMLSCYFYGGCPCESGMPAHLCGGRSSNVEFSAMAAPQPQLIVSDGKDWSDHVPEIEYPFLQRIYGFYGKADQVENVHLPEEGHDNGPSKRFAMYEFMARELNLNLDAVRDKKGNIDESRVTVEEAKAMYVFGDKGENLPSNAIKGFDELEKVFENAVKK
ncbi:MAG: acetylxylan esterase [Bacteroidales bacterium]|nr:acetylxylan esterase [Bacteroidales bacterium]